MFVFSRHEGSFSTDTFSLPTPELAARDEPKENQSLTFSWLNASILFMAVSKAVIDSRKAWSCSHSGLPSRSPEIFTAALDMADKCKRRKKYTEQ